MFYKTSTDLLFMYREIKKNCTCIQVNCTTVFHHIALELYELETIYLEKG